MKINRILIANRGEIAERIIRSCKSMGIQALCVYSTADRNLPFVKMADQSIWIGESEASDSYLNIDKIVASCLQTSCDAVHPGYGFLSENAELVTRLQKEGIIFIGPDAATMDQMGDKIRARELMIKNNVPVVPGYHGLDTSLPRLLGEAKRIGFPLMVKASAGGGGRGLRIVREENQLEEAITSAMSEAKNAFGSESIFLEKYIQNPKHIEVQVLADTFGHTIHLLERECSLQRRHQKVIEECPSPSISPSQREQITSLAIQAAKSVQYVGAGTVEFIYSPEDQSFYFLEMNTRLQVEHPVTEMVTGVDLVEEQIKIAQGDPLQWKQADIQCSGHSIEARIYAEDPANHFMPGAGCLDLIEFPKGPGIRVDKGVQSGSEISIYYDPMIAKLIVHAPNREAAIELLIDSLGQSAILGMKSNLAFLGQLLDHPSFRDASFTTNTIANHFSDYKEEVPEANEIQRALVAASLIHYANIKNRTPNKKEHSAFQNFRLW